MNAAAYGLIGVVIGAVGGFFGQFLLTRDNAKQRREKRDDDRHMRLLWVPLGLPC